MTGKGFNYTFGQPKRLTPCYAPGTVTSYLGAVVHTGAEVVGNVEKDHLCPRPRLKVVQLAL